MLHPILGVMAEESKLRRSNYSRYGCNIYDGTRPKSNPIMFWTIKDIDEYIEKYAVPICSLYQKGYKRTGCMFCLFGYNSKNYWEHGFAKMKKNTSCTI